jgi:hypothetical protein
MGRTGQTHPDSPAPIPGAGLPEDTARSRLIPPLAAAPAPEPSRTDIRREFLLGPVHVVTLAPQQHGDQVTQIAYELNVIDGWVRTTEWTDDEGIVWIGQTTRRSRVRSVLNTAPEHDEFIAAAHLLWTTALTQAGAPRRARDQRRALDAALRQHGLALVPSPTCQAGATSST